MKLEIMEPHERHAGPILVCDEAHNDIAEFFHNEHATVGQSYETALKLARLLVDSAAEMDASCEPRSAAWIEGWPQEA